MGRGLFLRGRSLAFLLLGLATVAGLGWWQRTPLLTWYYVRGLVAAEENERQTWLERVSALDSAAVPSLAACLRREDAQACANAQAALGSLLESWGYADPRSLALLDQVAEAFPGMSVPGQCAALELPRLLFKTVSCPQGPPAHATTRMLAAVKATDPTLQARALALAEMMIESAAPKEWQHALPALVQAGLKNPDSLTRVRAAHLTLHEAFHDDRATREQVVPLLRDPDAAVRRAALLALGLAQEAARDEELLPLLHDPDAEVRRLCEGALRSRGLSDDHLLLARLISDSRPAARLQVLDHLAMTADLEPGAWLRQLSVDPNPAVRAAAVRAAAGQTQVDLRERLRQLAQEDPSPTVRQLAEHYAAVHSRALAARP
jgi:hypothetical protein